MMGLARSIDRKLNDVDRSLTDGLNWWLERPLILAGFLLFIAGIALGA